MKINKFYLLAMLCVALIVSSCGGDDKPTPKVNNERVCVTKGGYWYKGKCWPDFTESSITAANVDAVVQAQILKAREAFVKIDGKRFNVDFFMTEGEKEAILSFNHSEENLLLFSEFGLTGKKPFNADAKYMKGNIFKAKNGTGMPPQLVAFGKVKVSITENEEIKFNGSLENKDNTKQYKVEVEVNESVMGLGISEFKIAGDQAFLSGTLGTITYHQLKHIIKNNPEVKTIVFNRVDGSINDEVNMHTGRILREAGLNTKVLSDSDIASGGVDLFAAGVERVVEKGAKLGVHSWEGDGLQANKIPKDHPAHQYQLRYFRQMLGEKLGPDFYFYTLNAAPADGMHYMSDQEIKDWKLATSFVEKD